MLTRSSGKKYSFSKFIASFVWADLFFFGEGGREKFKYVPWSSHLLIGNSYNGYINPYYGLSFPSPIIEIMGVDRPDRTYEVQMEEKNAILNPRRLPW